jgi:2,3-bisphosphoglycerate-independent phosphoglycerate mutase
VISEAGLRQHHTAETEKYAHVTYFFNGGRELPFPYESHLLVPSPDVATYDLMPAMSAVELTDRLIERLHLEHDAFILINFANPDMVGHTGDLAAAVKAVETVDACLGRLVDAIELLGGITLVTADHGNCEQMIDSATGRPHTAHTTNPVPFVAVMEDLRLDGAGGMELSLQGGLKDVAPTILALLELAQPGGMSGRSLIRPAVGA